MGIVHHFALVIVVVAVAIGGTAYLIASHADSITHVYDAHIASASCSTIVASAHDATVSTNNVQIDITYSGGASGTLAKQQVGTSNNTAYWTTPSNIAASTSTVYLTERVWDTISGSLVQVNATANPNLTYTLGACTQPAPTSSSSGSGSATSDVITAPTGIKHYVTCSKTSIPSQPKLSNNWTINATFGNYSGATAKFYLELNTVNSNHVINADSKTGWISVANNTTKSTSVTITIPNASRLAEASIEWDPAPGYNPGYSGACGLTDYTIQGVTPVKY